MKKAITAIALIVTAIAVFAANPLPPDTKFQGAGNSVQNGATLTLSSGSTLVLDNEASAVSVVRKLYLGTPAVATTNAIVTSTNMKVGAYTVADTTPDGTIPRNITVTATAGDTADTMGTIVIVGTDADGDALTETITPAAGSTVAGTKAFKTVTSVTGAGWAIDGSEATNDTIVVGFGALVGLPIVLPDATGTTLTTLSTTVAASATTGGTLATSTVDASGGTYNGSKKLYIYVDR